MICPHCGQEHPTQARFCPKTGKTIEQRQFCPSCGQMTQPDWRVCGFCGQPLITQTRTALPGIQHYGTTYQQRAIPRWALWTGGGLLALIASLLIIAVVFRLPGRLTGRYDAVAEKMPASTDVYVGINLLEVIQMQDSEQLGMLGLPLMAVFGEDLEELSNLSGSGTGKIDIQAAISSLLLAETGLDLNEDILPWAGQYAGIGFEVYSDEFGYGSNDEKVILAMEARNSKAADDFLKKLSLNLENRQSMDISEYEYEGVLVYSASRGRLLFARVENLVAFSPTEATLLSLIDSTQKDQTLSEDLVYKKLVSQTQSGSLARMYINGMSVGDVMYGEFRGEMGLFSQVFSSPVAAAAEGTLVTLSVDKDTLRFDSLMAVDSRQVDADDLDWLSKKSDVFSLVADDALVVLSGNNIAKSWRNYSQVDDIDEELSSEFGFNVTRDLFNYLDEEWVLSLNPAQDGLLYQTGLPMVGVFVAKSDDMTNLQRTIRSFNSFAMQEGGVQLETYSFLGSDLYEVIVGSRNCWEPMMAYSAADNHLFFGSSAQPILNLYEEEKKLIETPRFKLVEEEISGGSRQTFYLDVVGLLQFMDQNDDFSSRDLEDLEPYIKDIIAVGAAQRLINNDIIHVELIFISNAN